MLRSKESIEDWQKRFIHKETKPFSSEHTKSLVELTNQELEAMLKPTEDRRAPENKNKRYGVFAYISNFGWEDIGSVDRLDQAIQYVKDKTPTPDNRQEIMVTDAQDTNPYAYYITTLNKNLEDTYLEFKYETEDF